MRRTFLSLSLPLAVVALLATGDLSSEASAHTRLTSPTPRSDSDALKSGPCGNVSPTGSPMEVQPGDSVTVTWLETIDHPGYYRIALSLGGDDGFDDNVLADEIADVNCSVTPCSYTETVTIPDVECDECTLQLTQFMGTAAPYSPYFSCADLRIGSGGGSPDAGSSGGNDDGNASGGCQISSRSSDSGLGTLLIVCLVLAITTQRRHN